MWALQDTPVALPLLIGAILLYKLRDLARSPGALPLRSLCRSLLALTIASAISTSAIATRVNAAAGVPGAAECLAYGLILVAAHASRELLDRLIAPERLTRRRRASQLGRLLTTLTAIGVLKLGVGSDWWQAAYLLYLGLIQLDVPALGRRYARLSTDRFLSIAVRAVGFGSVFGMTHVALAGLALAAEHAGRPSFQRLFNEASGAAFVAALLLGLAGPTVPVVGSFMLRAVRLMRQRAAYRRLYPLWRALYDAEPAIALDPPRSGLADRLAWRDLDLRVYRRVIEIRDGALAVRPFQPAQIDAAARAAAAASGLTGAELDAHVEAACLEAGRLAKLGGASAGHRVGATIGWGELREEIDWLQRVARAYGPTVKRWVSELDTPTRDRLVEPSPAEGAP